MDFQKRAFHLMFDMAASFQTYAESQTLALLDKVNWLPEETKKGYKELTEALHVSGEVIKKSADEGFGILAEMFPQQAANTVAEPETMPPIQVKRIIRAIKARDSQN